jgi:hypothetical protein
MLETAFAAVTFQYQAKLILLQVAWIPSRAHHYDVSLILDTTFLIKA